MKITIFTSAALAFVGTAIGTTTYENENPGTTSDLRHEWNAWFNLQGWYHNTIPTHTTEGWYSNSMIPTSTSYEDSTLTAYHYDDSDYHGSPTNDKSYGSYPTDIDDDWEHYTFRNDYYGNYYNPRTNYHSRENSTSNESSNNHRTRSGNHWDHYSSGNGYHGDYYTPHTRYHNYRENSTSYESSNHYRTRTGDRWDHHKSGNDYYGTYYSPRTSSTPENIPTKVPGNTVVHSTYYDNGMAETDPIYDWYFENVPDHYNDGWYYENNRN